MVISPFLLLCWTKPHPVGVSELQPQFGYQPGRSARVYTTGTTN